MNKRKIVILIFMTIILVTFMTFIVNAQDITNTSKWKQYKDEALITQVDDIVAFCNMTVKFNPADLIFYIKHRASQEYPDNIIKYGEKPFNANGTTSYIGTHYIDIEAMNLMLNRLFDFDYDYTDLPSIYREYNEKNKMIDGFYIVDAFSTGMRFYNIEEIKTNGKLYSAVVYFYMESEDVPLGRIQYIFEKNGKDYRLLRAELLEMNDEYKDRYLFVDMYVPTDYLIDKFIITGRKEDDTYILELRDKITNELITFDNSEFPDRNMDFSDSFVMSPDGTKLAILTMTDTLKFNYKVTIIDLTNGNVINEIESELLQYMNNETFGWNKTNDTITFNHFDSDTWYTLTVDADTATIHEKIQALYEQLDTYRLPVREEPPLVESLTEDELISQSVPQMIISDDPITYLLAAKIRPLLWFNESVLSDFDDITKILDNSGFKFAALRNTSRVIDIYENHRINQLILDLQAEKRTADEIYYIDDIKDKINYFFGDANEFLYIMPSTIESPNGIPYRKYEREGIYVFEGAFGYNIGQPQIVKYEKTDKGYICEAVIISQYIIVTIDHKDITITKDNICDYMDLFPRYKFEFKEADDGRLILNSQETLYLPDISD